MSNPINCNLFIRSSKSNPFGKGFLYGLDAMRFLNARNFDEEWVLHSLNNKGIGEINGRDYIDYFNDYYNQKNILTLKKEP